MPFAFNFEQYAAVFGIDKADARVVCRHHDAVRHNSTAHKLDASHFHTFGELARPISALNLLQVSERVSL